ncbi:probable indole-3-pyruvate monooxygenase YUCCA10 [Lotus japonicus]|uniref:probable indole-3-pyruvate monooxygenase YUCCA10 n=1 Tax=Lotus japonicus TaxID=34305 RepID=UPI0025889231|nr:probable indole-3-pyruvate monooxygenase YUCCA10 [Lotus japonicus]
MEEATVLIVGAGPSGLAISACLTQNSISHIILEKEDCSASLWRKNTYDRLKLHLAKEFCFLPFMPHPPSSPTFLSKSDFVQYIDIYVEHFDINPRYCRSVESASYDEGGNKWRVETNNTREGKVETYEAKFLVIASGENSECYIPDLQGLGSFEGETVHSKYYKRGSDYKSKRVLVVGSGNSGMEIAYDLCNWGATTSILIRSPLNVITKELIHQGMRMVKYLPVQVVDKVITFLGNLKYGDLTQFGIYQPKHGPLYAKYLTGKSAVIDVGTVGKIKEGEIKVIPSNIKRIEKNKVVFANNMEKEFDAIVFATGYRSVAHKWLKDYNYILNEYGMPKNDYPNHWKGDHGLYCGGLARRGLWGVKMDAEAIAEDITQSLKQDQ